MDIPTEFLLPANLKAPCAAAYTFNAKRLEKNWFLRVTFHQLAGIQ